jgi:Cu(I)/Ag(I) efflux system membrane fusion protein
VEVITGLRSEDFFEVISGLKEGDQVVTSANFLIDSESSLRAALEAVSGTR